MVAAADIFISHSSKDDDFGRELAYRLRLAFQEKMYRGHEVTVWYDATHIHPGDVWVEAISSALGSCAVFLLILSPEAIQSDWVFDEFTIARSENKKIIPIVWKECDDLVRTYKEGRWTLVVSNQYVIFGDGDHENVDIHKVIAKPAFQDLYQQIEGYFGLELQELTEESVRSPEERLMQQLLDILQKNFEHHRWSEVILLSDMLMQQMEAFIPADVYYMRGVALQKVERYEESDTALALALALARPNTKEKEEKGKDKKEKDKFKERREKDNRIEYLRVRRDTLQKIGGRWKEIYHIAQEVVSLLPEDREWLGLVHRAQEEFRRDPRLENPPVPVLRKKLPLYTFGMRTLEGATRPVTGLVWSPNCEFLAAACEDGTVYTWRAQVGDEGLLKYQVHQQYVTAVDWSPGGTQVASASRDKTVHIWRLGEKKGIEWKHEDWVNDVVWSADGSKLASACQDRIVRIWDVLGQRPEKEMYMKHSSAVRTIAWHADNIHLAVGCDNGEVCIWNTHTRSQRRLTSIEKRGCIYDLIWLPERESVLAASADKHVYIWEQVLAGAASYRVVKHEHIVFALAHSSEGKYIASSDGNRVRVWERETEKAIFTNLVHSGRVRALAWASDDLHIASAGEDKLVQVWNFIQDAQKDISSK
jgi:WD40 repeat protein